MPRRSAGQTSLGNKICQAFTKLGTHQKAQFDILTIVVTAVMMILRVITLFVSWLLLLKHEAKKVTSQPLTAQPAHLHANDAWVVQLLALE